MTHFPTRLPGSHPTGTDSRSNPNSWQMPALVALGFAVLGFLVVECMHYLLVPNLGWHGERMVAEGVSALIMGCLVAMLFRSARQHHQATQARLQVIAEMNHHIRNALTPISLSAYAAQDQESFRLISEGVERIEWALREILPRQGPLSEQERTRLFYFEWREQPNNMPAVSERAHRKPENPTNQPGIEATPSKQSAGSEPTKAAPASTRGSAAAFGEKP